VASVRPVARSRRSSVSARGDNRPNSIRATVEWGTPAARARGRDALPSVAVLEVGGITADGEQVATTAFADEADLECIGGWIWVFGGIALALVVGVVVALAVGLWVVVRVVRTAKRQREEGSSPVRPDLSGR